LRGEVPFTFFEVVKIAESLNIPLDKLLHTDSVEKESFTLSMIEYMNMDEGDYRQLENYISLINRTKTDPNSEIAESSNILPISIFAKFDSLSKYFLFKYQYLSSRSKSRITFGDLTVPERLQQVHRSYFIESKNFAKTIYLWDFLIFQYLVTDIRFFSGINLISTEDIRQLKNDLFALLDYIEKITFNGYFEETKNPVSFYISDINIDTDYSYWQSNGMRFSLIRSFILNSATSINLSAFGKIKNWIHALLKSSTLITQSGAVYRAEFFNKQRTIVSEL
jgi:hypothetical protein